MILTTQGRCFLPLKYVSDILQTEEAFTMKEYKHTHAHTHTHTHTHTHRVLQQQQITGLSMWGSYEDTIVLHKEAKIELDWWEQNLDLNARMVHTVHCPTDSNPIRCFQVRLGSSVPRTISWRPLVTRGKKGAYQPSRIESSSYGYIDFRRETKTRVNSPADGQSGCISVHKKSGGYIESKNEPSEKRIVGNF